MSALHWGIKASFLGYIRAMADGSVTAEAGAELQESGAVFPLAAAPSGDAGAGTSAGAGVPAASAHTTGSRRFRGTVRFLGHGGVLDLRIADPAVEPRAGGWVLSIRDPYDPDARVDLATIAAFDPSGQQCIGSGLALTADGADLFFGPYVEGTPLDDFEIVDTPPTPARPTHE